MFDKDLDAIATSLEGPLQRSLVKTFERARSKIDHVRLKAAIEAKDINATVNALNLQELERMLGEDA